WPSYPTVNYLPPTTNTAKWCCVTGVILLPPNSTCGAMQDRFAPSRCSRRETGLEVGRKTEQSADGISMRDRTSCGESACPPKHIDCIGRRMVNNLPPLESMGDCLWWRTARLHTSKTLERTWQMRHGLPGSDL